MDIYLNRIAKTLKQMNLLMKMNLWIEILHENK